MAFPLVATWTESVRRMRV